MNYADDFVILCRRNAAEARERMEAIMAKKTRVCRVPEFLGTGLMLGLLAMLLLFVSRGL